jgi:hypothetical protein
MPWPAGIAGFFAGLIGTGVAIPGFALARFDLEKSTFVATSAAIDSGIDLSRMTIAMGHPGEHICAQTETNGADLVVISTHGRTGLKHVLVGSVVPSRDRSDLAS